MTAEFTNAGGRVEISLDVIRDMAGSIATKCYGVVGMASRNKKDGIVNLLHPESNKKGIDAQMTDDGLAIELHIILQYGLNIATISKSVSARVRYAIETLTGLKVRYVNIRVEGIRVS